MSFKTLVKYNGTTIAEITSAGTKTLITNGKLLNGNIELVTSSAILPDAYQQVEYIQSTGTQYIISDINMATYGDNFSLDYTAAYTSNSKQNIMVGWYYASGNNYFIVSNDNGKHKFEFSSTSYFPQGTSPTINLNQKYYIYYKPSTRECKVDNNSYQQTSGLRTLSYRSCNIPIFCYDPESTSYDYFALANYIIYDFIIAIQ